MRGLIVLHFPNCSMLSKRRRAFLPARPAAVEVIDSFILDSTKLNPEASRLRDFLVGDPGAIFLVEFYADEPDQIARQARRPGSRPRPNRALPAPWFAPLDLAKQERIWKLRKLALGLSMAEKGDAKAISFVEDTAVAPGTAA